VQRRRRNFEQYRVALEGVPGITFMPEARHGQSTRWLTVLQIDPAEFGGSAESVRLALEAHDIESRPVWKPLHLQPLFQAARRVGGDVAEGLFRRGLCLPSGSQMSERDVDRVIDIVLSCGRMKESSWKSR
jgi:pyridoxal phosphate-dependent aminotransferase EpsN